MMGPAGRASGGPLAPPQGGWVVKQNYVWFRRHIPIIWRVFSLFALPREMPRTSALSVYRKQRRPVREFTILRHLTRRPK
jgi:hypothetical protein